jgi:hypothetical protein
MQKNLVLRIVEELEKENTKVSQRTVLDKLFLTQHCSDENVVKAVKNQFDGPARNTEGSGGNLLREAARLGSGRSDSGESSGVCNSMASVCSFSVRSVPVHIHMLLIISSLH